MVITQQRQRTSRTATSRHHAAVAHSSALHSALRVVIGSGSPEVFHLEVPPRSETPDPRTLADPREVLDRVFLPGSPGIRTRSPIVTWDNLAYDPPTLGGTFCSLLNQA
ncbi:hypothetical protein STEG23_028561 [Scotinomys teguina]